jgi:AcrR family transcriptional regulator
MRDVRDVPRGIGEKLLAAADELGFRFTRASMDEIAKVSGVPRATIYYYFSGRDDLLVHITTLALTELAARAQEVADGPGTAVERLRALVRCHLDHLHGHRAASELLVADLGAAGLHDVTARITAGILEPIESMLAEGIADGSIRPLEDVSLTATALFGAVLVVGLQAVYLTGSLDADVLTDRLVPVFLSGLGPSDLLADQ